MGIRVHRYANVAVAHQVLQGLGIHAGSGHVAAVCVPAYVRSDAGQLHPIDLVVAVHHVLEPVLPVHGYLGRPVFIQVEEAGAAVYHDLLLGLSPFCNDGLEAFVDFICHWQHPGSGACFSGIYVEVHMGIPLQLMIDVDDPVLHVQVTKGKSAEL